MEAAEDGWRLRKTYRSNGPSIWQGSDRRDTTVLLRHLEGACAVMTFCDPPPLIKKPGSGRKTNTRWSARMIAHRMYDYYVSVYIYYLCCVSTCKASFGSLNSTVRDCPVSACHVLSAPHLWNALWDPLPPCLCSPASMEYQTSAEIFEMPENPVQQNVCDIATLDFPFSKWFSHFLSFIYIYIYI